SFGFKGHSPELGLSYGDRPFPPLVSLYGRIGLHRYNLLQDTKFRLERMVKYVSTIGSPARSYYITLKAVDGSSHNIFEVKVSEDRVNAFALMCNIARIRGDTSPLKGVILMDDSLPEWPPQEDPFEKHYLAKDSELADNDEWIRLYVKLAVAKSGRASEIDFENLKVAMDASDEGLNAKKADFYIRYRDLHEDHDHVTIVRRSFVQDNGILNLVGRTRSLESIPEKPTFAC
ncbi:unnamed protein product, partial [Thlaspi arvense]